MNRTFYNSSSIHTRRQPKDVFFNDPFKVQSYNFRYAERPTYLVQQYQRTEPRLSEPVPVKSINFETYYQNPRFNRRQAEPTAPPPATSAFVEYRRRKFLQDQKFTLNSPVRDRGTAIIGGEPRRPAAVQRPRQQPPPSPPPPSQPQRPYTARNPTYQQVTTSPLLSSLNRDEYRTMRRGQSFTVLKDRNTTTELPRRVAGGRSASVSSFRPLETNTSSSTFKICPKRSGSICSGCAISIDISRGGSEADQDQSFRINIATDACVHNNTDRHKAQATQRVDSPTRGVNAPTGRVDAPTRRLDAMRRGSTESFVIDKRLSKFNVPEVKPPPARSQSQTVDWARQQARRCEPNLLQAKRQLQAERDRLERVRLQEVQLEQQRARLREQERAHLRQMQRQRDREHLLELERLQVMEQHRQAARQRNYENALRWQEQQQQQQLQERSQRVPMRALSMPISPSPAVVMTSHLQRITSDDRLPGMVPCYVHQNGMQSARAERLRNCARNLAPTREVGPIEGQRPSEPVLPRQTLERRSSCSSNLSANIQVNGSRVSLQRGAAASEPNERKLLNLPMNEMPVSSTPSIHARLNNVPIRITTSKPTDRDIQFTMHRVGLRNGTPVEYERRGSRSTSATGGNAESCNVNINVYADNMRPMRL